MDAATPSRYAATYAAWQADPGGFWAEAAKAIDWVKAPKTVFDPSQGVYGRWFPDAVCNTCHNAVDRHAAATPDRAALIYDSPVTGLKRSFTYGELKTEVATFAAVLADLGVTKGDRVILYMPMVPEAVFAMLACARIGAIHSVVFGGFASKELATRIDDCHPKVIVTASCGIEGAKVVPYKPLLDEAIDLSVAKPEHCVVLQRPQVDAKLVAGRDFDWEALVTRARLQGKQADCVPVVPDV
jgi:propionyl-CoA synthetase